jgi:type II secretory pathway pseudopilin PulG
LLEMMVALTLVTVVMAALTVLFVNTMASTSHLRSKQVATSIASSAVDKARGLGALGSESGRDSSSVTTQFAGFATTPVQSWLTTMTPATDGTATAGQGTVACDPTNPTGRCADLPTVPVTQTVNGKSFSTSSLVGTCWRAGTDTSGTQACDTTKASGDIQYFRVVVAVSWSDTACASDTCYFITAILLNGQTDPTFNFNSTPPASPQLSGCTSQTVVVGDVLDLPVIKQQSSDTSWVCALSGGVPPFTWSATGVPSGIVLDQTGHFVGTVGAPTGTRTSSITTTDAFLRSTTGPSFTWTVNPGVTIAVGATPLPTASLINTTIGTVTLTASGGLGSPYSWSAAGLPPGTTLARTSNTQAQLSGRATAAGTYSVIITATDTAGTHTGTTAFTWTVYPSLAPTNPGDQSATVNTAITPLPLPVSGGSGVYTISITSGSLPSGLSLTGNSTTGYRITGTPTATTTNRSVTVTIKDAVTAVGSTTETFAWTVYPQPTMPNPANQTSKTGQSASLTVAATGCQNTPCSYTATNLPSWLSIDPATAVISGTAPATPGSWSGISVTVTDNAGAQRTSGTFSWTVVAAPILIDPADQISSVGDRPALQVSTAQCPNGGCTYSEVGSNLSALGLSLSGAGMISGTAKVGSRTITVKVTDAIGQTDQASFTWTVYALPTITAPGAQRSGIGQPIAPLGIVATCTRTPCTFTATGLPAGISIDQNSGVISGTPSATGSASVTVTVTDSGGHAATTAPFSWTVFAGPTITTPGPRTSTQGTMIATLTVASSCPMGSCTFAATGLPAGLSIGSSNGQISGTPTAAGSYSVVVTITDPSGNSASTNAFSWTVTAPLVLTVPHQYSRINSSAAVDLSLFAAGGTGTYTFTLVGGTLPGTLTLRSDGTFSGNTGVTGTGSRPPSSKTYSNIQVRVTDSSGASTTSTFTWTVSRSGNALSLSIDNQASTVGVPDVLDIWGDDDVTGGVSPYTFAITSGTLPNGLTLDPATGVISGTPTTANSGQGVNIAVRVTDQSGDTDTDTFRWKVSS